MLQEEVRQNVEAALVRKAWMDAEFKEKFHQAPKAVYAVYAEQLAETQPDAELPAEESFWERCINPTWSASSIAVRCEK